LVDMLIVRVLIILKIVQKWAFIVTLLVHFSMQLSKTMAYHASMCERM
jgi:hypothetical protein